MTNDNQHLDPVYLHARREAIVILIVFAICCVWALAVCWLTGYQRPGETWAEVPVVLGMPAWVFWGVFMPWMFADVVTIAFVLFYMKDDDLGENEESGS